MSKFVFYNKLFINYLSICYVFVIYDLFDKLKGVYSLVLIIKNQTLCLYAISVKKNYICIKRNVNVKN